MRYSSFDILLGSMLLALAIVFPLLFHALGLGSAFLPMFFPILVAGYVVEVSVAVCVGVTAPLLSAFLTGMPPFFPPIAFIMMAEGAVLGGLPALLNQKKRMKIFPSLLLTLLGERFVLLLSVMLVAKWLSLPQGVLGFSSLLHGVPGILLILVLIPPLVKGLKNKLKLFPQMQ